MASYAVIAYLIKQSTFVWQPNCRVYSALVFDIWVPMGPAEVYEQAYQDMFSQGYIDSRLSTRIRLRMIWRPITDFWKEGLVLRRVWTK